MKKLFISIIALVCAMTMSAQTTADVTLRLQSQSGSVCELYLFAGPDLAASPERGSFMANASNPEDVNIYAVDPANGNSYASFGNETLVNIPVGIITSKEAAALQNYTIHFEVFEDAEVLKLKDLVTGTETNITNGGSYAFTIAAATDPEYVEGKYSTIANRFLINYERVSVTGSWSWDPWLDFVENGDGTASVTKELTAGWYNFGLHFGTTWATNGYAYKRSYTSTSNFVGGSGDNMSLNADVDGIYTFKWEYATNTFSIIFPALTPVCSVTTNEYGWASFSYNQDLMAIESGLKIYKGAISGDVLNLSEVNYVKADEGVILYGTPGATYSFGASTDDSDFAGNDLKPASAWASHAGTIYCLKGDALYEYTGSTMPDNKAYLQIGGASAPRRISFRFNQPTAIENAKAAELKAEKFIENGQILIKRGENVFNLQGQIVK